VAAVLPFLVPLARTRRTSLASIQTTARRHPDLYCSDLALMLDLLVGGEIAPSVTRVVALEEVPEALAALARGEVTGKQVIGLGGSAMN
jgi:D-arabinose 1-dehydrogenase-like Zn-dependent alcohol dehydrogenase